MVRPVLLTLLAALPARPIASGVASTALNAGFHAWKSEFGRVFATAAAENAALRAFAETEARIAAQNANPMRSFSLGHNEFSGMTEADFLAVYAMATPMVPPEFKPGQRATQDDPELASSLAAAAAAPANSSFDWQSRGVVGPVQQQGVCGACYAFSVAAAIESALAIQSGRPLIKLSEMDLIECGESP